ncbi:MAG: dTDP-4-dehydrorhamnose 3,5-epimerase [Oscillospiraceae bacterium]|nr:dTDP-4-dehydrorhamnose 3,5-epimerase [Oscillospiraceae bacterium]
MAKLIFEKTKLQDMLLIRPFVARDERGYFIKSYERMEFEAHGIHFMPFEENQSCSQKGTIRGLHFQREYSQDKLVRVLEGEIFDVGVDLRRNSPTFGQWVGYRLSAENQLQLYIPKGFAHGFLALTEGAVIHYLAGDRYHPDSDGGIRWDDPDIGIAWPLAEVNQLIISQKDTQLPALKDYLEEFGGFDL